MSETPNLRWFEKHARCVMCRKRSHGVLRGSRNESYGQHCTSCANKRLKASEKVRKRLDEERCDALKYVKL